MRVQFILAAVFACLLVPFLMGVGAKADSTPAPPGATVPVPTVLVQTIYDYLMAGGTISEAKSLASQLAEAATAQQREAVEQRKREDEIKRRVEEAVAAKAKEAPAAPAVPGAK